MSRDQLLTDHTATRVHGHYEGQLCCEERDTEVDVDIVPHAPKWPVGSMGGWEEGREGGREGGRKGGSVRVEGVGGGMCESVRVREVVCSGCGCDG